VPNSVTVAPNSSSANFTVTTSSVSATTAGNITATYSGITKSAALTVNPAAPAVLSSLSLNPTTVVGGSPSTGTVKLNKAAPAGGAIIALTSNKTALATLPAYVTVAAGAASATFTITTKTTNKKFAVSIGASYQSVTKKASLTVIRR
jgi:hypothetical protein